MNPSELVRRYPWTFMYGLVLTYLVLAVQIVERLP